MIRSIWVFRLIRLPWQNKLYREFCEYLIKSKIGKIIEMDLNPSVYVYRGMIIQETDIREKIKLEAQILNKNNEKEQWFCIIVSGKYL